jgi:replicative superfamily II helicase
MPVAARRQLESAAKRLEKSLADAQAALQELGKDLGQGSRAQYKHLEKAAKAMRKDAEKTNKRLLKDLEKFATAISPVASSKPPATARKRSTALKPAASGATARKPNAAARKPARARSRSRAATSGALPGNPGGNPPPE